jgi:hypothetical protein
MTEHLWTYRTGKCLPSCPGCAARRRARTARLWATVAAVLVGAAVLAVAARWAVAWW